jgi:hypothetical protein
VIGEPLARGRAAAGRAPKRSRHPSRSTGVRLRRIAWPSAPSTNSTNARCAEVAYSVTA